jgi:hypothetical protein
LLLARGDPCRSTPIPRPKAAPSGTPSVSGSSPKACPVFTIAIDAIPEFDQNCWFRDPPTCREVAEHARQIMDADLDFPVIFSADGRLMDGGHRIAKAWLLGHTEIKAQRFDRTPEPEYILAED